MDPQLIGLLFLNRALMSFQSWRFEAVADLLLCFESLSCYMTQFRSSVSCRTGGLTFGYKILWYTEEFMASWMTARCPGPAKQAQIIMPPPPCLEFGLRVCGDILFGFNQMRCCECPNISTSISPVQRILFQKSCCSFRCNAAKLSCPETSFQTSHTSLVLFWIVLPKTFNF